VGGVGEERRSLPPTLVLDALPQHLVNGLVLGGTYALLGIGLTLIFGLMNLVNFAHGEFYTLGAYATFATLALGGLNFFTAIAAAIVVGAGVGALCERVLLRPLRGESIDTTMLVMIGLWIAMQNGELLVWGGVAKSIPHPFPTAPLTLGPVGIAPLRVFVVVTALVLIAASWLLIQRTRLGSAILAISQDPQAAQYMGIPSDRIFSVVMAISAALAAAAGVLAGPFLTVQPTMWLLPIVKAFAIVVVGGLGSIPGSILAALMLGYAETIVGYMVSTSWTEIVSVLATLLMLVFRPAGIFGRRAAF